MSSPDDVARAVPLAAGDAGRVDVLCNNAAYLGEFHAVAESTPDEWDRCIQVSLFGTHHFTKAVLPYMIARQQGSIVNIVSIQAMVGCPTSVAYTTTKAGLLGYTLSAAYDYGRRTCASTRCAPARSRRDLAEAGTAAYDWQCAQTVLGRVGTPREVAYGRAVPRVGRGLLHHRRRDPGRRRLDLQVTSARRLLRPDRLKP